MQIVQIKPEWSWRRLQAVRSCPAICCTIRSHKSHIWTAWNLHRPRKTIYKLHNKAMDRAVHRRPWQGRGGLCMDRVLGTHAYWAPHVLAHGSPLSTYTSSSPSTSSPLHSPHLSHVTPCHHISLRLVSLVLFFLVRVSERWWDWVWDRRGALKQRGKGWQGRVEPSKTRSTETEWRGMVELSWDIWDKWKHQSRTARDGGIEPESRRSIGAGEEGESIEWRGQRSPFLQLVFSFFFFLN